MPRIDEKTDETVTLEKGYYHGVFVLLNFNKEDGVDRKEDQVDVDLDPDEEKMQDVRLDDKKERHWRMVLEGNAKGWYVYMNGKKALIKGGYSMEVSGSDGKTIIWEVVDDNVVQEGK